MNNVTNINSTIKRYSLLYSNHQFNKYFSDDMNNITNVNSNIKRYSLLNLNHQFNIAQPVINEKIN